MSDTNTGITDHHDADPAPRDAGPIIPAEVAGPDANDGADASTCAPVAGDAATAEPSADLSPSTESLDLVSTAMHVGGGISQGISRDGAQGEPLDGAAAATAIDDPAADDTVAIPDDAIPFL